MNNIRLVMYSNLAPYSKDLKINDVLTFSWDEKKVDFNPPTLAEKRKIKNDAKTLLKKITQNK